MIPLLTLERDSTRRHQHSHSVRYYLRQPQSNGSDSSFDSVSDTTAHHHHTKNTPSHAHSSPQPQLLRDEGYVLRRVLMGAVVGARMDAMFGGRTCSWNTATHRWARWVGEWSHTLKDTGGLVIPKVSCAIPTKGKTKHWHGLLFMIRLQQCFPTRSKGKFKDMNSSVFLLKHNKVLFMFPELPCEQSTSPNVKTKTEHTYQAKDFLKSGLAIFIFSFVIWQIYTVFN